MKSSEINDLFNTRTKRKIDRIYSNSKKKPGSNVYVASLYKKINNKKLIKTHLRNFIVLPLLINKRLAVHNGIVFNSFEAKINMIGKYFGEFSISYKFVNHGRPGLGASKSSRFIPLR
mmetsp:Transcript_27601/g.43822  ORF Transcript_27601/g.43822 Transcript_27601/m.43822 type:complete len:118 (+) Transcript_27601:110-463(+)